MLPLLNLYKYTLLNDTELRSLTNIKTYKHKSFLFKYSSELAPLKNKNKISIKQVIKKFLAAIFFFWLFIFVLLLFGPILKYRKNKSAKG